MTPAQQQALFENTARAMGDAWQHIKERHIARPAMKTNTDPKPLLGRKKPLLQGANRSSSASADAALEFGRFRVQLRHRTRRVWLAERRRQSSNFYVPISQLPYSHCNVAGVSSTASCTPTAYGLLIDRFGLRRLRFRTRRPAPRDPGEQREQERPRARNRAFPSCSAATSSAANTRGGPCASI